MSRMQVNILIFITSSVHWSVNKRSHVQICLYQPLANEGLLGFIIRPNLHVLNYNKITIILILIKSEVVSPMFPNVNGCSITLNFTFSHCTLSPPVKMSGPKKIKLYTLWRVFIKQQNIFSLIWSLAGCQICQETASVFKECNTNRHFASKHVNYVNKQEIKQLLCYKISVFSHLNACHTHALLPVKDQCLL